jgi:hypothetical protein
MPPGGVIELGKSLFLHGNDRDVVTQGASGVEDEKRESAVAGNQA